MISEKTRLAVLERDSWQCRQCGAPLERGTGQFATHHLSYDSDDADSLVSLCHRCHRNTDHSGLETPVTTSLRVTKDTRDRVMSYLASLIGERGKMLTQDDAVNAAMDCVERERNRKK